jgi:hypothetical protein
MATLYVGMKRPMLQKLASELVTALATNPEGTVSVELYNNDPGGMDLTINNEDMERDEVPDEAIYVERI